MMLQNSILTQIDLKTPSQRFQQQQNEKSDQTADKSSTPYILNDTKLDIDQPVFKRRLTRYLKIKSLLKNKELEEYKDLASHHDERTQAKLNYFYGAYDKQKNSSSQKPKYNVKFNDLEHTAKQQEEQNVQAEVKNDASSKEDNSPTFIKSSSQNRKTRKQSEATQDLDPQERAKLKSGNSHSLKAILSKGNRMSKSMDGLSVKLKENQFQNYEGSTLVNGSDNKQLNTNDIDQDIFMQFEENQKVNMTRSKKQWNGIASAILNQNIEFKLLVERLQAQIQQRDQRRSLQVEQRLVIVSCYIINTKLQFLNNSDSYFDICSSFSFEFDIVQVPSFDQILFS